MNMERSPRHHVSHDGLSKEPLPTDNELQRLLHLHPSDKMVSLVHRRAVPRRARHLGAAAQPGGHGDKALNSLFWSSLSGWWSETPPLLGAICLSWWGYPLRSPWSLARGGCAFSSCPHPPGTWHGELSMPTPLTCLLLIASLNHWGERRGNISLGKQESSHSAAKLESLCKKSFKHRKSALLNCVWIGSANCFLQ